MASQPFWLSWAENGKEHRHPPDFFARLADGTGLVIDVRPDDRIEPEDARAFAATERARAQVGWAFRRTAGPGLISAENLRWLAGYRHRRYTRSDVADLTSTLREVAKQGRLLTLLNRREISARGG